MMGSRLHAGEKSNCFAIVHDHNPERDNAKALEISLDVAIVLIETCRWGLMV